MRRLTLVPAAAIALLLAGCNLAGDVTPPPGVSTVPQPAATQPSLPPSAGVTVPSQLPNPGAVAGLYGERCAPCHGDSGMGDGPQAGDLPLEPAPLAAPDLVNRASPAEWYRVVTEGRMDRFMPPFTSLTDEQRWDLVAYSLSLSLPQENVEADGLYQEQCADCHAADGSGTSTAPPLMGGAVYAERSRADIRRVVAEGVGSEMPAFGEVLTDAELDQVAAFVQSLSFDAAAPMADPAVEQPSVEQASATVTGQVFEGASGGSVQSGIEVTLHGFEGDQEILTQTAETGEAGEFAFDSLPVVPGQLYLVSTEYQGVRYASEVVHLADAGATVELPLVIYSTTNDPGMVFAPRVHLLLEQPAPDTLQLVELWVLVNQGQSTVVPTDGVGGVEIPIPQGAQNLRFEDSLLAERYFATDSGFSLAAPMRPGGDAAQVVFSVDLSPEADQLRQLVRVPVEAITVLVSEGGPRIEGPGVIDQGVRDAGGQSFHQYDLGPLAAGDLIQLDLKAPSLLSRLLPRTLGTSWAIGLAGLALALGAVLWWYRPWERQKSHEVPPSPPSKETRRWTILKAIAELDESYEAGALDEEAYQKQRSGLKQQALDLMRQDLD